MAETTLANNSEETKTTLFPSITNKIAVLRYHLEKGEYADMCGTPTRRFSITGTVKLHGTHADIVIQSDNTITFQSRNRLDLTPQSDNLGFASYMSTQTQRILALKGRLLERYQELNHNTVLDPNQPLIIVGEWIGRGIQRGVAIQAMDVSFVMISLSINGTFQRDQAYADIEDPDSKIYNISRGGFYHAQIDLDDVDSTMAKLKAITDPIDAECPFAKSFGLPPGAGEGIVWKFDIAPHDSRLWLKTKGQKFTPMAQAPKRAEKDRERGNAGKLAARVAQDVTHQMRLNQGLEYLQEMGLEKNITNISVFGKWIVGDVEKEELGVIKSEGVDKSMVMKAVTKLAVQWYKDELAEDM